MIAAQQRPTLHQTRRNLPHFSRDGSIYFLTFRVKQGQLTEPERQIVLDACTHWHGQRMTLHAAVVMHDHVHLLLNPAPRSDGTDYPLSELLHSIKSFSANAINRHRNATGPVWLDESFDRIVRDAEEFDQKARYIRNNPVKAGLVERSEDYAFLAFPSAVPADHRLEAGATDRKDRDPTTGLKFTPARYAKTFQTWHENLRDWCISRQLWWGHRIPVWFVQTEPGQAKAFNNELDKVICKMGLVGELSTRVEGENLVLICSENGAGDAVAQGIDAWMLGDKAKAKELRANWHWLDQIDWDALCQNVESCTQDPDVLDTWFSSALWPLSTLGWPDDTPDLQTWNPTSVLCTAREIITLWVSRMVMFNLYFRGTLPFKDVFIHAMIQDGHGQKMSKSLGNGVDPMDIIHSHGSDAMRFTLASMTTQTQDVRLPVDMLDPHTPGSGESFTPTYITTRAGHKVAAPIQERNGKRITSSYGAASGEATPTASGGDAPLARNTSEKFDLGQRFANKMWNATRFALTKLDHAGAHPAGPASPVGRPSRPPAAETAAPLSDIAPSLPERWILSRLARTVEQCNDALKTYAFSEYATALYDFFWRDLCDWYIEAIKPRIAESPTMQRTLAACLDAALRLLHPVMPFVTERLWEALNDAWPDTRSVDGLMLQPSELLVTASWPRVAGVLIDEAAEQEFARLQEVVGAIREARNRAKVPPRETIELSSEEPAAVARNVADNRWIAETLANFRGREFGPDVQAPDGAAVVLAGGCKLYLHGLGGNAAEETDRLDKEAEALRKSIANFEQRLSNKKYVDKAPAHLVQETRDQLAATQQQLATIEAQRAALG